MDVGLVTCVHSSKAPVGGKCVTAKEGGIDFKAPSELMTAGFPHADGRFAFDCVQDSPSANDLYSTYLKSYGTDVLQRQNAVVMFAGKRATPKRELAFGPPGKTQDGVLYKLIKEMSQSSEFANHTYKVACYLVGNSTHVKDLFNLENDSGVMAESLKGPPIITGVTEEEVSSWAGLEKLYNLAAKNYQIHFEKVLNMPGTDEPFPAYQPENLMFAVRIFPVEAATAEREDGTFEAHHHDVEQNSLTVVILGDSERPALCGIDSATLGKYEDQQKTLSAVVNVLGAIRCKRLRVPFGKCRVMHLLKRAFNSEKNNPYSDENKPTVCHLFLSMLDDARNAEETYHSLTFGKRIMNVIGGSGVGPASRDLAVERWRLEQDIIELKDELEIVKTVHGYKPVIYNQAKPVANIKEEEQRRVNKILKQREDAKAAELEATRAKASHEAQKFIEGEQKKSNQNIAKLEKLLGEKTQQNAQLNEQHSSKIKEYEKQLEKVRKKRKEEEEKTEALKKAVEDVETQLQGRQESIEKLREQLEVLNKDHTKGTELIIASRKQAKEKRDTVSAERKELRAKWLAEIKSANEKIVASVTELDGIRKSKQATLNLPEDEDADTKESITEDVMHIDRFVNQMIVLDEPPANAKPEKTEDTRKQLMEYFTTERKRLEKKLSEELDRRDQLDKAANVYKSKINEQSNRVRKDQMSDAVKKEKHLESLLEQVVQYLEHGCRMTKIRGSERKRYLFISEDRRRIHSCEVDEDGMPANKRRPTTTAYFKDIKRIILGQYTPNFKSFEAGRASVTNTAELIHDVDGAYNRTPTSTISPENMSAFFYRSFSLEFKKGKTWDVVAETDSDFEAWVVVLQRLLVSKDEWSMLPPPSQPPFLSHQLTCSTTLPSITHREGCGCQEGRRDGPSPDDVLGRAARHRKEAGQGQAHGRGGEAVLRQPHYARAGTCVVVAFGVPHLLCFVVC